MAWELRDRSESISKTFLLTEKSQLKYWPLNKKLNPSPTFREKSKAMYKRPQFIIFTIQTILLSICSFPSTQQSKPKLLKP